MHARISTLEGSPEHIDEGLRQVRQNVLPQLQQQEGFKGMVALANRQTGTTLGITFWENEQDERASRANIPRLV